MRYEIKGDSLPVLICYLDKGEKMLTESGGMSWMSSNMKMETTSGGGLGKAFGRMMSGNKAFQNVYTAEGGPGLIAFASSFPGALRAIEITPDKPIIVQKSAYLASTEGVQTSVFFQKKLGAGLFSGEGFIMQKLSGNGIAFVEIDGYAVEYDLKPGQEIVVETGHVATMSESCSMDLVKVKGVKNILFGGEGLFNTIITGPGKVTLQSMPAMMLAKSIAPYIPTSSSAE